MPTLNFLTVNRPLHAAARRIGYCLFALGLAVPTQAYPLSLQRLLELPLEALLQLEINVRAPASPNAGNASPVSTVAAVEVNHVR